METLIILATLGFVLGVAILLAAKRRRSQSTRAREARPSTVLEETDSNARETSPVIERAMRSQRRPRLQAVDVNIGIDFGTSTTKVCMRQNLGLDADALLYPIELEPGNGLLCPSLIVFDDGHMCFGAEAQRRSSTKGVNAFPHLKVCLACEAEGQVPLSDCAASRGVDGRCRGTFPCAGDVAASELVTCFLAWVIGTAKQCIPRELGDTQRATFTYNIGAPVGQLDEANVLANTYRKVADAAIRISDQVRQDVEVRAILAAAREALAVALLPESESVAQIRPEAEAAMISHLVSPDTAQGLYGIVDVGAWTTDVSIFRLTDLSGQQHAGDRTVEYYAACSHRGALNKVDEEVCGGLLAGGLTASRMSSIDDVRRIREHNSSGGGDASSRWPTEVVQLLGSARTNLAQEILGAFRMVLKAASGKALDQSHWMKMQHPTPGKPHTYSDTAPRGQLSVVVVGGGAKEPSVWKRLNEVQVAREVKALDVFGLVDGLPGDVGVRYAVAQGLAFPAALWPRSFGPSKVPPFARPRRRPFRDLDEIG